MKLYFAVLSVVDLKLVVHLISGIVFDVLLQYRVPVDQKPAGNDSEHGQRTHLWCLTQIFWIKWRRSRNNHLPPHTYFLTKTTPPAMLSSIITTTATIIATDFEEWPPICEKHKTDKRITQVVALEQILQYCEIKHRRWFPNLLTKVCSSTMSLTHLLLRSISSRFGVCPPTHLSPGIFLYLWIRNKQC